MRNTRTLSLLLLLVPLLSSCGGGGGGGGGDPTVVATDCSSAPVASLEVSSVTPANNASNVSVDTVVSATFNACVDMSTVSSTSFIVTNGALPLSGSYSFDSTTKTLTFTPSASLIYDSLYIAALSNTILGANGETFTGSGWAFRTRAAPDTTPPVTTPSVPGGVYNTTQSVALVCDDGATGTGCAATYYTTDGSTPTTGSNRYSGAITISNTTTLQYFSVDVDNNAEAVNSTQYTLDTVPPGVSSTSPADTLTGVPVTASISATFSEAILEATLNANSFTVDNGVTGTITYDAPSNTATLTPSERLACNTVHTVNLGPGITDLAGNALSQPASWSFTTSTDCSEPVTTADVSGGVYTTAQSVTLSCNDGGGSGCARLVYTTDGSIPSFSPQNGIIVAGALSGPIALGLGDTTLRYFAEDNAGNREVIRAQAYSISNSGYTFVSNYTSGISRGIGMIPDSFVNFAPPGNTRSFFTDATTGRFYRGAERGLYVSDDNSASWTRIVVQDSWGSFLPINGIFAKGSKVYLATTQGLYISTDGGASYQKRFPATTTQWTNNVVAVGNTVYVASSGNGLGISTDKGQSFSTATTAQGLGSDYVNDVIVDGTTVYVATNAGLSISTDGGASFINKTTTDGLAHNTVNALFLANGVLYAATDGGLSLTADSGASFSNRTVADGLFSNLVNDVYVSGANVYLATGDGISLSSNAAASFNSSRPAAWDLTNNEFAITAVGSSVLVGQYPSYFETTDNGLSWEQKGLPDGVMEDLVMAADGTLYFHLSNSSGYSSIVMTRDKGQTFTVRNIGEILGGSAYIQQLSVDGNTLYVATNGIATTSDGINYTVMTTANGLSEYFIYGVYGNGTTVYSVSVSGFVDKSTDGGASFTATGLSGLSAYSGLAVNGNNVFLAGYSGLNVSNDNWASFVTRTTADGLTSNTLTGLAVDGSGNIYVAMSNYGVAKSADNGTTFSTIHNTGSSPSSCGGPLFIGGGSGLYISTDAGATFSQRTTANGLGSDIVNNACYVP